MITLHRCCLLTAGDAVNIDDSQQRKQLCLRYGVPFSMAPLDLAAHAKRGNNGAENKHLAAIYSMTQVERDLEVLGGDNVLSALKENQKRLKKKRIKQYETIQEERRRKEA